MQFWMNEKIRYDRRNGIEQLKYNQTDLQLDIFTTCM